MNEHRTIIQAVGDDAFRTALFDALETDAFEPTCDWPNKIRANELPIVHDRVLFDYLMIKCTDSLETSQIIRALRDNAELRPIIVVTDSSDGPECRELFSSGADDVVWSDQLNRQQLRAAMSVARKFEHQRTAARNQQQLLAQLRDTDNYAQLIIDHSMDMIIAVDLSLRITEFNRAAEETFGYSRAEILGEPISKLYADPSTGWAIRTRTFRDGYDGEVHNRRKNGEVFTSLLRSAPIIDQRGQQIGVMGISREASTANDRIDSTTVTKERDGNPTASIHAS